VPTNHQYHPEKQRQTSTNDNQKGANARINSPTPHHVNAQSHFQIQLAEMTQGKEKAHRLSSNSVESDQDDEQL
jgi:hypothetical protein